MDNFYRKARVEKQGDKIVAAKVILSGMLEIMLEIHIQTVEIAISQYEN